MSVLKPFSSHESIASFMLESELLWTGSRLDLRFVLLGKLNSIKGLRTHRDANHDPVEGLWESTCFEAFFGAQGSPVYYEVNATTDGRWMVFRFENERVGRTTHAELRPAAFACDLHGDRFEMDLRFDFSSVAELAGKTLIAAPAAVLEETNGAKSYWSLTHSQKPDFHNPAHRLLTLKP